MRAWAAAYGEWDERQQERIQGSRAFGMTLLVLLWVLLLLMVPVMWAVRRRAQGGQLAATDAVLAVAIPVALGIAITWAFRRKLRAQLLDHRLKSGLCPACGYDLRASPGHCPECGPRA